MIKKWIIIILVSGLSGLSGAWFLGKFNTSAQVNPSEKPIELSRSVAYSSAQGAGFDFVKASEIATQCVVFIKTTSEVQRTSGFGWFFDFDPFGSIGEVASTGSGVIISKDGYIVTNNHVIKGAKTIEVVVNNKKKSYKFTQLLI